MRQLIKCLMVIALLFFSISAHSEQDEVLKFYESYVSALNQAKSIDDISDYLAAENLEERDDMSAEEEAFFLEFIKETRKSMKTKSIKSNIEGDKATINIEALDTASNSPITGTVDLIKENGKWKIKKESFHQDLSSE